uniref:T-cell receptor alpha/delta variable 24.0.3 n=1 Tax=Myripristis murdjan TaxID=586833 RepID=A0A667WD70_9TELE
MNFCQGIVVVQEGLTMLHGSKVKLSCRYSSSRVYSLLWYRQYPGSAPQFLILENSGIVNNPIPGLGIQHVKEQSRVDLEISSAEVTDSALYYCAVQPTVTGNTQSLYKNLWRSLKTPMTEATERPGN